MIDDFRKYREISFKIMEECRDDQSIEKENYWIDWIRLLGLSLTNRRPATKNFFVGVKRPPEECKRISQMHKGKAGRRLTAEESAMMRSRRTEDSMRRIREGAARSKARPVVCETTSEVFPNAKLAAAKHGVNPKIILRICQNKPVRLKTPLKFSYL